MSKAKDPALKRERRQRDLSRALLFSRVETSDVLGVSVATLIRLEAKKKLKAVKPFGTRKSKTFYRAADVRKLARGAADVQKLAGGEAVAA